MKLKTEVTIAKNDWKLDYDSRVFCIGSCFSEELHNYLSIHKFQVVNNPHGITYNPISICNSIKQLLNKTEVDLNKLVQSDDLYKHLDFHGHFASTNEDTLLSDLNERIEHYGKLIKEAGFFIITLGTAFAFKHKQLNTIVNNCHKQASNKFERILLSEESISSELDRTISLLRETNPDLKVLLTVSPVRHIRDGLVNNQRSKSILLLTCHSLADKYDFVNYFPSYEILLDELRDYRFYKQDMIHPSQTAVEIILNRFKEAFISEQVFPTIEKMAKLHSNMSHKPLHPNTAAHKNFLTQNLEAVKTLQTQFPQLDFSEEYRYFDNS